MTYVILKKIEHTNFDKSTLRETEWSQSHEAKSFKDMPVEPPKKSLAAFLFFGTGR